MISPPLPSDLVGQTRFVALDFESAGSEPGFTDVPVQVGWAIMENMEVLPDTFFRSYLFIHRPVTWSARKVHGITNDDLHGAPDMLQLWPKFKEELSGSVLVAHGAGTEKRYLRVFPYHPFKTWIDTLQLAKAAFPDCPDYSLSALIQYVNLAEQVRTFSPHGRWHDALHDAIASLVFLRFVIQEAKFEQRELRVLLSPEK